MGDPGLIKPMPAARSRRVSLSSSSGMFLTCSVTSCSRIVGRYPRAGFLFGLDLRKGRAEVGLYRGVFAYVLDGLLKFAAPPGQLRRGE
jgi:hypothetical protein